MSETFSQTFLQRLEQTRPCLAAKARLQIDKISGETVLLYPEGVVILNATGEAIVRLCDGSRSFHEILAVLSASYGSSPQQLESDVSEYLRMLYQQCLIELRWQSADQPGKEGQHE